MESKNSKVFVASIKNLSKKLEFYGDADISKINLLKLIYKYACYSETNLQLQKMNSMVHKLQNTDDMICSEFQASSGVSNPENVTGVIDAEGLNQHPVIQDISVLLISSENHYTFSFQDLFLNYSDDGAGGPSSFFIEELPSSGGTLFYDNQEILVNVLMTNPSLLKYERDSNNLGYNDSFNFVAYDDDLQLPLQSNIATCQVLVEAFELPNQPATVGDRNQYVENRTTTVFTVADFTTNASPEYFDPENNPLDAIRIDVISSANDGVLYYIGAPVEVGQIITASEIAAGSFYHVGPDENTINSDSFELSVRDTGSMIWVQ